MVERLGLGHPASSRRCDRMRIVEAKQASAVCVVERERIADSMRPRFGGGNAARYEFHPVPSMEAADDDSIEIEQDVERRVAMHENSI